MKNPRRIALTSSLIDELNLSTKKPPKDSLFWQMWEDCTEIAKQALATKYVQAIGAGDLKPVTYGAFNVVDAYYCFNGAQDYLLAESRTEDHLLRQFLLLKYQGYQRYNSEFTKIWHIRNAEGVIPDDVCKEYSQYESRIASHEEPIYSLIVMLPCEYLWYWLSDQLFPPAKSNLYSSWITGNHDPNGAYAMGNFIHEYQKKHPSSIDVAKAKQIYKQATTYEYKNFAQAV